ncbi:cytochrome P450 [Pontibacter korlensis]|uniref:Cytochrome P450 n=1 Tax=Pontibacter korlensis TaxID=400092 RepID=A0A0E3ZG00_9BACT|nr:cytochrome P450 [Pontibacter korlensis]AKD04659.1 cytochrome P450 [Pontibacter korlensis]
MRKIPKERTIDNTLAVLMDGYPFLTKRMEKFNSKIFKTRLLGEEVICLYGKEAAALMYDNSYFWRQNVIPKRVQNTLMGTNGVQMLDDEQHHHRKALFMSFMSRDKIQRLMELMLRYWRAYAQKWEKMERVVLFDEASEVMYLAASEWAGVAVDPTKVREHAQEYINMIFGFGGVAMRYLRGVKARNKREQEIGQVIENIRSGKLDVPKNTAAYQIAWFRDLDGELLDTKIASVELINVIRPIVAIANYVAYSALALHEHPEQRNKLASGEDKYSQYFVQEVRRLYPFTPFLGARTRKGFEWNGYQFDEGKLVLLDAYGMLHDPEIWPEPYEFKPERFSNWSGSPFDFIPQGGGDDFYTTHRCAGEWITIEAMKVALKFLTLEVQYEVPQQDLSISLVQIPTKPKSGIEISNIVYKGHGLKAIA